MLLASRDAVLQSKRNFFVTFGVFLGMTSVDLGGDPRIIWHRLPREVGTCQVRFRTCTMGGIGIFALGVASGSGVL